MRMSHKRSALAAGMLVTAVALTSCAATEEAAAPVSTDLAIGAIDLSAACPANIVIQTDWNPESEHGHLYSLLGDSYEFNADAKSVSGPLMASGEYTGVNVEIRAGGPAIGFSTVTSQMYTDDTITLGYANTDEAVQLSADMPTTAVFAPLDKNPQMIMWDPETYPDVSTIAELGATGAIVRYFGGSAWMEYMVQQGILSADQIDGSYDGAPANFVAAAGADAQQGFASAEPYIYQNEIDSWGKPVAYQLINDAGWEIYQAAVSVRTGDLADLTPCLEQLVPVLQQAEVDYFASPDSTTALILAAIEEYDNGWVYSEGVADFSVETMLGDGIVSNGDNATLGDFNADRMKKVFDVAVPLFTGLGNVPAEGLTVDDIYTNEFIDEAIGLP